MKMHGLDTMDKQNNELIFSNYRKLLIYDREKHLNFINHPQFLSHVESLFFQSGVLVIFSNVFFIYQ